MPSNEPSTERSAETTRHHQAEYMVVARRYRPQTFEDLVGQAQSSQALRNAITTSRVGHAYLFTGARGVGKTSTARIFAKALDCVDGPTTHPCNTCDICQGIATGEDVDVLEIDGASNRGIDEIRQLRSNVNIRPSRARFKIYIIDEVHMLTPAAFNALLKTLEEPPEHVKFIFCTTDPEKIPITVLSRCQRFDFPPVETGAILGRLRQIVATEGVTAEEEALILLARRANGSMRDSQSLLEQLLSFCSGNITVADVHRMLGTAPTGRLAAVTSHIVARDVASVMRDVNDALAAGVDPGQFCEQLLSYFRDMMASACGCESTLMLHTSSADYPALCDLANRLGLETILAAAQILDHTLSRLRLSTHVRTLVEIALVRICHLEDLDQIPILIAKLNDGSLASLPAAQSSLRTISAPTAAGSLPVPSTPATISTPVAASPSAPSRSASSASSTTHEAPASSSLPPTSPAPTGNASSTPSAAVKQEASGVATPPDSEAVQKKTPVVVEPGSVRPPTIEAPAAALSKLDENSALSAWRQALDEMADMTASAAQLATRIAVAQGDRLSIGFPKAHVMQKEMCERPDRKTRLEQAVGKVLGRNIRIDFALLNEEAKSSEPAAPVPVTSQRQRIRDLQRTPFVGKALELFDGEIMRLEERRPSANNQADEG